MKSGIVIGLAVLLSACGEPTQAPLIANKPTPAAVDLSGVQARTAPEILALFMKDIATCISAVSTFDTDKIFVSEFGDAEKRQSKSLEEFLRKASFVKSEDIQYILSNRKYFDIGVTYHPNEFAVAWAKTDPIYCAPSMLRQKEIEKLGESPEAWEIRLHFLNRWLLDLRSPSDEADYFPEQYDDFNRHVGEAAKLYTTIRRVEFNDWLKKATAHFDTQRSELIDGAGGETLAEQSKTLDMEIAALKMFGQSPLVESVGGQKTSAVSSPATPTPSNTPLQEN